VSGDGEAHMPHLRVGLAVPQSLLDHRRRRL
jgi:hypothetical protein